MLIYATMWMSLKNIMLSEKSHVQKTIYYMILFTRNARKREIYETESRLVSGCLEQEVRMTRVEC